MTMKAPQKAKRPCLVNSCKEYATNQGYCDNHQDKIKKKEFLNVVTEIFNFNLQGDLEEFSDSLGEYDSKQIEEAYNSLVDESLWDDCFDELADNIITEVEQSDLDVEIPEEFKSCLAQLKSNELQKLLDEYKENRNFKYIKLHIERVTKGS